MDKHEGLPVKGYRPQTQDNIDLANEGKMIEELARRWLDKLQELDATDKRLVALGVTNIQAGFMWAIRGIFMPGRLEDKTTEELLKALGGSDEV